MNNSLNKHSDPNKTVRNVLPYTFRMTMTGKVCIGKTNGQVMIVSRVEVENILTKDDLDVHRRRMYEAALEVFKENDKAVQ